MNGSIQTLVAILVLVGGASAANSEDAVEASPQFVSNEEAKNLCFGFLKDRIAKYILPADIAEMMQEFRKRNQGYSDDYLIEITLQRYERPISCPKLVEFWKETESAIPHRGWLNQDESVTKQITAAFRMDAQISEVLFAKSLCDRLAHLELVKEEYQSLYNKLVEAYKQIIVPKDVEDLSDELVGKIFTPELLKAQRMPESCPEFVKEENVIFAYLIKISSRSVEQVLFDNLVYKKLMYNPRIELIHRSARNCEALMSVQN